MSLALLALVLAGCSSVAPRLDLPALPVAQGWGVNGDANEGVAEAHALHWRDYFVDPGVISVIEAALANSRDLRLALLRVEEARALYGVQRAEQFPSLGLGAQGARARTPGDLSPTGRPVVGSEYTAYVGMNSWEIDLWGRVRSLKDGALQEYLATQEAQRASRVTLIAEVASTYEALRALDERVAVVRETIASREESFRIFNRRNAVGSSSRLELTQVQTLLYQARSLGAQLEQQRAAQAHALVLLAGVPLDLFEPPRHTVRTEASLVELAAGLPSDLLIVRPDVVAAEHRLRAASANIGAARAAFFPRIALTGSFGTASAELDGLFGSGSRAWSFAPTISLPIFDGGSRRASLDLAEIRRNMAVANYEKTIQVAFREAADALSARHWLFQQVAIQRDATDVQAERARLAQLRFDSGAAAYLEVLDAQRELLDTRQQLIQTRSTLRANQIALYAALGGSALDTTPSPSIP